MATYLKYPDFWRRCVVRNYNRLETAPLVKTSSIILPRLSAIHYIPDSINTLGIDSRHPLLRNVGPRLYVDHLTKLKIVEGAPRELSVSPELAIKSYHRINRTWARVKNLDDTIDKNKIHHMVVNYSMIPKRYRYVKNNMVLYQEYQNMRATLWEQVGVIGDRMYQFIPFVMPTVLPGRMTIRRFREKFTLQAFEYFHSIEAFDVLDFWRILAAAIAKAGLKSDEDESSLTITHPAVDLPPEVQDKVHFCFFVMDNTVTIKLSDIINWAKAKPSEIDRKFYKLFDSFIAIRNSAATDDAILVKTSEDTQEEELTVNADVGDEDGSDDSKPKAAKPVEEMGEETSFDSVEIDDTMDDGESAQPDDEFEVFETSAEDEQVSPVADVGMRVIENSIKEKGELGLLSAAEQRGLTTLSKRWETIKDPLTGLPLKDVMVKPEDTILVADPVAPLDIDLPEDAVYNSALLAFERKTVGELYHKDIVTALLAPQLGGIIVKDVKIDETLDAAGHVRTYRVQVQPIKGAVSTLSVTVPVVQTDGTFTTGGVKYRLEKQKKDLPIMKIAPNKVALDSYYGKIFITRNDNAAVNYERWINKKIVSMAIDLEDGRVTKYAPGSNRYKGVKLPRRYTAVSASINGFTADGIDFKFNYHHYRDNFVEEEIKVADKYSLTLCGHKGDQSVGMDESGNLYIREGGAFKEYKRFHDAIDPDLGDGPMEYAEIGVFNRRIPIVLALSYLFGLDAVIRAVKAPVRIIPASQRVENTERDIFRIKFKDVAYLIDVSNPEHRFLFAGFNAVHKKISKFTAGDMKRRSAYLTLLSDKGITQSHLQELIAVNRFFVDFITFDELVKMKEPTDIQGLFIRSNELLMDDFVPEVDGYRLCGYERVAGMVYNEIAMACKSYLARPGSPENSVAVNSRSVFLRIIGDSSKAMVEESNPIHEMKEVEAVTVGGWGGRSTVTMTKEPRSYKANDFGVIGESSPDSGKVGIRTGLSTSPNIVDLRGNVGTIDLTTAKGYNMLTVSGTHAPASNSDDSKRQAFTAVQNSHTVACVGYNVQAFRTGEETMIGFKNSDNFTARTKQDGVVLAVTDEYVAIRYKDDSVERFSLETKYGVATGTSVPLKRTTDVIAGQKIKAGSVVVWNSDFFERDIKNPMAVALKFGRVMNVAFVDTSDTDDDGMTIAASEVEAMSTPVSNVRDLMLDFSTKVHDLLKVGDVVEAESILCILEDAINDEYAAADRDAVAALSGIGASTPKAQYSGRITKIEVLYNGELDNMSESVRKIVTADNARRAKNAKLFGGPSTGGVKEVMRIGGNKLVKGKVCIRIYIESLLGVNTADKFVVGNQLKCTASRVVTDPMIAEDGTIIHVEFGYRSGQNRVVKAFLKEGLINAIMAKASKTMATM